MIHPIDRLVRQANPVPDHTALEPAELSDLLELEQWRETVDTQVDRDTSKEPRKPRGLLIGIAAAVMTIALIGAVAVAVNSGDQPVAGGLPIGEYPDSGGGDLAGTRWKVWAYQADGELAYTRPGETAIILQFGYDGTISGTGGCNTYEAGYAVSGDYKPSGGGLDSIGYGGQLIAFNDFTATETVCAAEVTAAEAAYFAALQEAGRWSIENDRELNLSTEDNTDLIGARPQPNN